MTISSPWGRSGCIRPALHPARLPCFSVTCCRYLPVCSLVVPCRGRTGVSHGGPRCTTGLSPRIAGLEVRCRARPASDTVTGGAATAMTHCLEDRRRPSPSPPRPSGRPAHTPPGHSTRSAPAVPGARGFPRRAAEPGRSAGVLDGAADYDETLRDLYDVADRWTGGGGESQRCRLWDDEQAKRLPVSS